MATTNSLSTPRSSSPGYWWNTSYRLFALLALSVGALYLYTIWLTTSNTPYGDGYIQAFFTVLHWQDGHTLFEKISNTWWTYFQHRAVFTKTITLLLYAISDSIDLHIEGLISNIMLVILVGLIAYSCAQHKLPAFCSFITALLVLTVYPWSVSTWPECALFYFSTLTFAFLSFLLLDLPRPQILAASICCWLSAFTMANGLLTVITGSLVVIFNHICHQRYSRLQIAFWFASAASCLLVYVATMNVFSTDLFGAKSIHDSFINVSGRLLDFVESMGAVPFFPHEYRTGKIALGALMLTIIAALLVSRRSWKNPAIIGLLLFNTGTIFITSLFRYSAGDNDGYQIFTATNYAAIFTVASLHIRHDNWRIPAMTLLMAITFNINALWFNFSKMLSKQEKLTGDLQEFLVTGKPNTKHWLDVILHDAIDKNIYRPLQSHSRLPIAQSIQKIDGCQSANERKGSLQSYTGMKSFSTKIDIRLPAATASQQMQMQLCSNSHSYLIDLSAINSKKDALNIYLTVLLDKRTIAGGQYLVQINTGKSLLVLPEPLTITPVEPWGRADKDCKAMQFVSRWKAFEPLINHYCDTPITQ